MRFPARISYFCNSNSSRPSVLSPRFLYLSHSLFLFPIGHLKILCFEFAPVTVRPFALSSRVHERSGGPSATRLAVCVTSVVVVVVVGPLASATSLFCILLFFFHSLEPYLHSPPAVRHTSSTTPTKVGNCSVTLTQSDINTVPNKSSSIY